MPEYTLFCKTGRMNSFASVAANPLRLAIAVAALLSCSGAIRELSVVHAATDPNLRVTIIRTNQDVVLSWPGSNAVTYQVESSSNLAAWTNSSSVLAGNGAFLFVTNPHRRTEPRLFPGEAVDPRGCDLDATDLAANTVKLNLNGGLGDDELIGSQGGDSFNGGDGIDGIYGGDGDDTFTWNPGDDNDSFNGQTGNDTLQFNGANVAETINLSASGARLRFSRNVANVITDCDDVETIRFEALGGADFITVNDLSATDVTAININLASTLGGSTGDAQPDSIIINGTGLDDVVTGTNVAGVVTVAGLSASVNISNSEAANDRVTINVLAGDDVVEASGLAAGIIALTADGGADDDVLVGSAGADVLLGGAGDDVLLGGPGVDILDGGRAITSSFRIDCVIEASNTCGQSACRTCAPVPLTRSTHFDFKNGRPADFSRAASSSCVRRGCDNADAARLRRRPGRC